MKLVLLITLFFPSSSFLLSPPSTFLLPSCALYSTPPTPQTPPSPSPPPPPPTPESDVNSDEEETLSYGRYVLKSMAQLSLLDYSWRRSLFESSRATDHKSIRPLDSADLGQAESKAVAWLEDVVDAETQRAQKIIAGDGLPRNATLGPNPLGEVEDKVRKVLSVISTAETQRVLYAKDNQDGEYGVFRPPSAMPAKIMGALGNAERMIKGVFSDIASAETTRANLGRAGEENSLVRPMDVPGALGDAKKFFADIQRAEWKRSAEKMEKQVDVVRPMDASVKGPLGAAEEKVVGALNDIKRKEEARLSYLVNSMPMESDSMSVAGIVEAVGVGVLRAPYAVGLTIRRVFELLKSEARTNEDEDEVEGEGGYDGEEV